VAPPAPFGLEQLIDSDGATCSLGIHNRPGFRIVFARPYRNRRNR
jgi:hypothetical protein